MPDWKKLIEGKIALARRGAKPGKARGNERIPAGQKLVTDFPVLDLGIRPQVSTDNWSLRVHGLVANELALGWEAFGKLPQVKETVLIRLAHTAKIDGIFQAGSGVHPCIPWSEGSRAIEFPAKSTRKWDFPFGVCDNRISTKEKETSDFHCVTRWSMLDVDWEGVRANVLLALAQPLDNARFAILHGYDGYMTNLPLAALLDDDVIIAHSALGEPLAREHGGPVRLVVPKRYAWKSAKWLQAIELCARDQPGFWEERGYHNEADPWQEQRFSNE